MTRITFSAARLDDTDRQAGRNLSLAFQGNALFYHSNGRLLGDELHPLARHIIGEIACRRRVITLPGGWYDTRQLWPEFFAGQAGGEQGAQPGHVAVVANDQFSRQIDGQAHQCLVQGHLGHQSGLGSFVHGQLHRVMARLKALFRGSVE